MKPVKAEAFRGFAYGGGTLLAIGTNRAWEFVAKSAYEVLGMTWDGHLPSYIPSEWRRTVTMTVPRINPDGTRGFTRQDVIVITQMALYMLAFRSNKPSAVSFTEWVAGEVLPAIEKNGYYALKRHERYLKEGKSPEWIEEREEAVAERKEFTAVLKDHDAKDYPGCTNAIYRPLLGGTATYVRAKRQLAPRANIRDNLSIDELAQVKMAEMLASDRIEEDELRGSDPCRAACRVAGDAVAKARKYALETPLG